jgi:hypothetical protein
LALDDRPRLIALGSRIFLQLNLLSLKILFLFKELAVIAGGVFGLLLDHRCYGRGALGRGALAIRNVQGGRPLQRLGDDLFGHPIGLLFVPVAGPADGEFGLDVQLGGESGRRYGPKCGILPHLRPTAG